jgi:hypothetical protein
MIKQYIYKVKVKDADSETISAIDIPEGGWIELLDISGASFEIKGFDDGLGVIMDAFDSENEYHSSWHCLYDDLLRNEIE